MGEILGLGITHYPGLTMQATMAGRLPTFIKDPLLPERWKDPANWPEKLREEWGNDEGEAHQQQHRASLIENFRWARKELDAFNPEVVLVWADDQYENFKEDCVPPFAVLAYDEFESHPWQNSRGPNSWNESAETTFHFKGARLAGKYLTTRLLEAGFDIPYAYKPLHYEMGHGFRNTALYLDWDRNGFPYPMLPITVNSYGRKLLGPPNHNPIGNPLAPVNEDEMSPPGPQPWRCFDLGRAIARAMVASPWRVALVASSSWSHSFLTSRYDYFHGDVPTDKKYFEAMQNGDYEFWRKTPLEEVEAAGHHEVLNWYCLIGAMAELGRKPDEAHFLESWLCNSSKVFTVFRP
jgi:hypothetical protein